MQEMRLRDAKAPFSAVVDAAEKGEATVVTRHGRPVAVVVGHAEGRPLTGARKGSAEQLPAFPAGAEIERDPGL